MVKTTLQLESFSSLDVNMTYRGRGKLYPPPGPSCDRKWLGPRTVNINVLLLWVICLHILFVAQGMKEFVKNVQFLIGFKTLQKELNCENGILKKLTVQKLSLVDFI